MINKKLTIILMLSITFSLIATVVVYNKLPIKIPMHFNIEGEVDRYTDKNAVFTSATLPLIILILMIAIPKFDKKKEPYIKNYLLYNILTALITLFILAIHWISIFFAFGYEINTRLVCSSFVGILFCVIGGFINRVESNSRFGIRLPSTMKDENNWRATHNFSHYIFLIAGILSIISCFFNYLIGSILFVVSITMVVILPIFYSLNFAFKNKKKVNTL